MLRAAVTLTALTACCAAATAADLLPPLRRAGAPPPPNQNICGANAVVGRAVVGSINASFPGLDRFSAAVRAGDLNAACEELVAYYKTTSKSGSWLRFVPPSNFPWNSTKRAGGSVDDILNDVYYLSGVRCKAKIPRDLDGGLNWTDHGPRDDPEFMNCLNRHSQWEDLVHAWQSTGNEIYAEHFSALVEDWVMHLPCRDGVSRSRWDAPGRFDRPCATGTMESPWRVLEAGIRTVGPWPVAFYGSLASPSVSTSARVLMLLGFSEHLAVIAGPGRSAHTPNWAMTQWSGLITTCCAFPELMNATSYLRTGFEALEGLLNDQVYPDGMETELAFGYDMGTANDFFGTMQVLKESGVGIDAPAAFRARVENMFAYGALVVDQNGFSPRNGDADLGRNGWSSAAQRFFERDDWLYVHTNGANGTKPDNESPSVVFPWGGHVAFKSGYEADGLWAHFDNGLAYGSSGHAHRSKMALCVRAHRSMLLVDSGRFAYQGKGLAVTLNREYERETHAHNTLTIDGHEQLAAPALTTQPVAPTEWHFAAAEDYARGSMDRWDGIKGTVNHRRAVYFDHAGGWLAVIDQVVSSDTPRAVSATWHVHPNASLEVDSATGSAMVGGVDIFDTSKRTAATCAVTPATGPAAAVWATSATVRGVYQSDSTAWQGWYSQTYTGATPASVIVYNGTVPAASSDGAAGSYTFGWLITTSADGSAAALAAAGKNTLELVEANASSVRAVATVDGVARELYMPLAGEPASAVRSGPAV